MVIRLVDTQNEATAATIVAFGVMAMEENAGEQYTLSNIVTIVQYHNYLQVEVLLICRNSSNEATCECLTSLFASQKVTYDKFTFSSY